MDNFSQIVADAKAKFMKMPDECRVKYMDQITQFLMTDIDKSGLVCKVISNNYNDLDHQSKVIKVDLDIFRPLIKILTDNKLRIVDCVKHISCRCPSYQNCDCEDDKILFGYDIYIM